MGRPGSVFRLSAPTPSEHALQIDCTTMLRRILLPTVSWTAIDHAHSLNMAIGRNGRPIGLLEAQKRKARGVKPGISDYLFWHRKEPFAIEMKKSADDDLSADQEAFLNGLIANEVEVAICWTIDQVYRKICDWKLVRPGVRMAA